MEDFGIKGRSGGRLRWLTLKGGEPIRGYKSSVGLTSPPHIDTGGDRGQAHIRGEPIRVQVRRNEKEGRGLSVGYQSQGDTIRNGLFPDTGKPPASVFCDRFLDKPETLFLSGGVCTTPDLNSNKFTA